MPKNMTKLWLLSLFFPLAFTLGLCAAGDGPGVLSNNTISRIDLNAVAENMHLTKDPKGFYHIGNDGVLRSFSEEGDVLSYIRLTRDQLLSAINTYYLLTPAVKAHLTHLWSGADSSKVSVDQIWRPPGDSLPLQFADPERYRLEQQQQLAKTPDSSHVHVHVPAPNPEFCHRHMCYRHEECKFLGCFHCLFHSGKIYGDCI